MRERERERQADRDIEEAAVVGESKGVVTSWNV